MWEGWEGPREARRLLKADVSIQAMTSPPKRDLLMEISIAASCPEGRHHWLRISTPW